MGLESRETNKTRLALLITVAIVTVFAAASCFEPANEDSNTLKLTVTTEGASEMPKNNELCILCHMDFDEEEITAEHISEGITCAGCHGASVAHMHDETMMTGPDILYGRLEVEGMCSQCHEGHKKTEAVEAFREEWYGRKRENGRGISKDSICTDCHGLHTVARR